MEEYQYEPLQDPKQDIRLVTILPGEFNDAIRIRITHHRLVEHEIESHPPRLSLKELQQRLPDGWDMGETLGGRYIFEEPHTGLTTWTHPDPTLDPACYRPEEDARGYRVEPEYEALSYVWGSKENPERIAVEGSGRNIRDLSSASARGLWGHMLRAICLGKRQQSRHQSQTHIFVTQNLAEAIRHLRHRDKTRSLWIDALCINQADDLERGEQIACMGRIYSRARGVVAFLGPGFPGAEIAFSRLDYLGRQIEFTLDNYSWRHPDCSEENVWKRSAKLPFTSEAWAAVVRLSEQAWFTRLWVLQEIQLASTRRSIIKCGSSEISWPVFRRALLCIYKNAELPGNVGGGGGTVNDVCFNCGDLKNMPFDEMLFRYGHGRLCQDQRDIVYGLLSMAPPELVRAVRVDYKASVMEVFRQFFLASNQVTGHLDLLRFCGRNRRDPVPVDPAWPSWVPDWRAPGPAIATALRMGHCASGVSGSAAYLSGDGRLEVDGLLVATVDSIVPDELESMTQVVAYLKSVDEAASKTPARQSSATSLDMYLRVLTRDRYDERKPTLGYGTLQNWKDLVREGLPEEKALSNFTEEYMRTICDWWNDQVVFNSKDGRLGASMCSSRPGDQIFVVLGCTLPLIMRQNVDGTYQVIGDCYFSGVMDGEAILGELDSSWNIQIVREEDGENRPHYINAETGEKTSEDPRLRNIPLPPEWENMKWERTRADPLFCSKFRNTRTDEIINSDPRLFPDALRARGIDIQRVTLV
ncbi:HET-domain-containing protein [Xylaria cf. heliscus]|nr:HET-domain-containing protein [Xylaria cf. heliscus]